MSDLPLPWVEIVEISAAHDLSSFQSSQAPEVCSGIDDWLRNRALEEHPSRCSTHVCLGPSGEVVGFYSLKMTVVDFSGTSNNLRRRFAEVDSKAPAILLAKMGLDLEYGGNGFGKSLAKRAIKTAVEISNQAACRLLVVDAKTVELVDFYKGFGFTELVESKKRLMMKMSNARKLVGVCP